MAEDEKKVSITSYKQSGGITAHTVNLHNRSPRRNLRSSMPVIVEELKKHPVAAYRLHYSPGDTEAHELANDIDRILTEANWQRCDPIQRVGGPTFPEGITVFMLKPVEPIVTFLNYLWEALGRKGLEGQVLQDVDNVFKVHGWPPIELPAGRHGAVVFIGPNPGN